MKEIITSLLAVIMLSFAVYAVQVDGYCFLQNQTNHEGTRVIFEADPVGGGVTDSTYTRDTGYYQIDLAVGMYIITFSHEGYYYYVSYTMVEPFGTPPIPDVTLYQVTGNTLSGSLSGTLASGNYLLTGNISISNGDSLIVESGVIFLLNGNYAFDIDGYLYAVGTEDDSINFIFIYNANDWEAIDFNDSASDFSRLEYCSISGSNSSGITCLNSSPTIAHCTILDNGPGWDSGGGIYCDNSNPTISNCLISGNTGGWGNGGGIYCLNSDPIISGCTINDI